jgi:hypothetical protein
MIMFLPISEKNMRRASHVSAILVAVSVPALAQGTCPANLPNEFRIELTRLGEDEVVDQGVKVKRIYGDVGVNRQNFGRFYENLSVMIAKGTYKGALRYQSNHNFIVSSCGVAARTGDFLIEVTGVKDAAGNDRTNILMHPGYLPSHSAGCILFGARRRDPQGNLLPLEPDYPLVKIRREFYGTDNPNQCPNKVITIVVGGP